jgi:hypothetical protein
MVPRLRNSNRAGGPLTYQVVVEGTQTPHDYEADRETLFRVMFATILKQVNNDQQ